MTSHYLERPLRNLVEATMDATKGDIPRLRALVNIGVGIMEGYQDMLGPIAQAWMEAAEKELEK